MNDKELLELASKAAGCDAQENTDGNFYIALDDGAGYNTDVDWNPLIDDGDAFRLAVKLGMNILIPDPDRDTFAYAIEYNQNYWVHANNPDPYAATRRAIVKAAAEVGKSI